MTKRQTSGGAGFNVILQRNERRIAWTERSKPSRARETGTAGFSWVLSLHEVVLRWVVVWVWVGFSWGGFLWFWMRIPNEAGRGFRLEAGTVPIEAATC